jgi:hypothetical protein
MNQPIQPQDNTHEIFVKYVSGAYVTNTVHGRRSSSTCSAETAAHSLADKLFGSTVVSVVEDSGQNTFVRRFLVTGGQLQAPLRVGKAINVAMRAVPAGQTVVGDGSGQKVPLIPGLGHRSKAGK